MTVYVVTGMYYHSFQRVFSTEEQARAWIEARRRDPQDEPPYTITVAKIDYAG